MPSRHLISTVASVGRCPHCAAVVFSGWAEGLLVHCDPTPLTPAVADAGDRTTYVLSHQELVHRDDTRAGLVGVIFPEHRCASPVPAAWRASMPTPATKEK